jgi:heme-degrading monooxygenase HmoA
MSVLMTLRVTGDGSAIEKMGAEQASLFESVIADAKERGLISHHFYASEGEVLVVDEWPDEQAFQSFFETAGPRIEQIMGAAGVTSQPAIEFWRPLDVGDEVG